MGWRSSPCREVVTLQVPRKSRPTPGRPPARVRARGRVRRSSQTECAGAPKSPPPRRWEGAPGATGSVPGSGTRQAARRRSPVAARALVPRGPEGRSCPRSDPARQAGVCTWRSAEHKRVACSASALGVPSPSARPLPAWKRRGAGRPAAPQLSRAAYAPNCPWVPHGWGLRARTRAAAASASGAAPRRAGRRGRCGSPRAAALGRGGAVQPPRGAPAPGGAAPKP